MNEKIQQIIARYGDRIRTQVKRRLFKPSEEEFEALARHWANRMKWFADTWERLSPKDSVEIPVGYLGWHRLSQIAEVLGEERVKQIFEDENKVRFMTRRLSKVKNRAIATQSTMVAPEKRARYTVWSRCIIFHWTQAGDRGFRESDPAKRSGWCWMNAEDVRGLKLIEHSGFRTAEEALESAQKWEYARIEELSEKTTSELDALMKKRSQGDAQFPWEDLMTSRNDRNLQDKHPIDLGMGLNLPMAKPCPKCGTTATQLEWFYFSSPPRTWDHMVGCEGWVTVCLKCKVLVDFFCDETG